MIAWFFSQYVVELEIGRPPTRAFPTTPFNSLIEADNGAVHTVELPFNNILIGVNASRATLRTIAAAKNFELVPSLRLDEPLTLLSISERNALRAKLNAIGHSDSQIAKRLGSANLIGTTLREVFKFAGCRWHKPTHYKTWANPQVPEFEPVPFKVDGKTFDRGALEFDAKATMLRAV